MGLFTGGSGRARGIQKKAALAELKGEAYAGAEKISNWGAIVRRGHVIYGDGRIECTDSCNCEKG